MQRSLVGSEMCIRDRNLSNISAHEKIEHNINKMITNLTTKSALKKSFHKEKSVEPPKPTTCAAISCSI